MSERRRKKFFTSNINAALISVCERRPRLPCREEDVFEFLGKNVLEDLLMLVLQAGVLFLFRFFKWEVVEMDKHGNTVIVCDNGTGFVKCGYADYFPNAHLPVDGGASDFVCRRENRGHRSEGLYGRR